MKWLASVRWTRVGLWSLLFVILVETIIILGIITKKTDPAAWANLSWVLPFYVRYILLDAREYIAPVFICLICVGVGRGYQIRVQRVQVITEAKRYGKAERTALKGQVRELTETNAALARQNLRYRQSIAVHAKANDLANENEIRERRIG